MAVSPNEYSGETTLKEAVRRHEDRESSKRATLWKVMLAAAGDSIRFGRRAKPRGEVLSARLLRSP
jgi:hypothetical protein